MVREIAFDVLHEYDTLEVGIVVPTTLTLGENVVELKAKVDTGAAFCVFERIHGSRLGLEIENGIPLRMMTANGGFDAFGHSQSFGVGNRNRINRLFRGGRKFLFKHLGQTRFFRPRETRFD